MQNTWRTQVKTIWILLGILTTCWGCSSTSKLASPPNKQGYPPENITCQINGDALNWSLSYCMSISNAKKISDKVVQLCLEEHEGKIKNQDECQKRLYYKTQFCEHAVNGGQLEMKIRNCITSESQEKIWWQPLIRIQN